MWVFLIGSTAVVQVSALLDPEMLVEVEVEAVIDE